MEHMGCGSVDRLHAHRCEMGPPVNRCHLDA